MCNNQSGDLFMCTNEIFEEVLSVVCDVNGIERANVLENKDEVSTDAR